MFSSNWFHREGGHSQRFLWLALVLISAIVAIFLAPFPINAAAIAAVVFCAWAINRALSINPPQEQQPEGNAVMLPTNVESMVRELPPTDETEKRMQDQARLVEAFYKHAITPLAFLDSEFHFIRVNEAYAKACRKDAKDFQGKSFFGLCPCEDLEAHFREVERSKKPFAVFARPFVFLDHPEWAPMYWNLSVSPLLDSVGEVEFLVVSLEDVTSRTVAERRAKVVDLIQALFTTKTTLKDYLESVVDVVRNWSGCENVGIRVVNEERRVPYVAYCGFSDEFMRLEANLSLDDDACICLRVVAGNPVCEQISVLTKEGSFVCNNTSEWIESLPQETRGHYRGTCIRSGYESLSVIPIRYRSNPVGALHLADPRENALPVQNIEFLESMAPLIAEAIHRFRVEERLRKTSLYARSIIEASLDPLVTISSDGTLTDVNNAAEIITGISRTELIGTNFWKYFTNPENARRMCILALMEGQATNYQLAMHNIAGDIVNMLCNAAVYRNETGEVQGVFVAARDVTELKRIEEALRDSQKLLADAQRIAHLGGWEWNLLKDEISLSEELFRIFGFEPKSGPVSYAQFLRCLHPGDLEKVGKASANAIRGEEHYDIEYRIVQPDKTVRTVHAQGEVVLNEIGAPVRMLGTVLDITEQKRNQQEAKLREQQLLQADKMVSLGILVSGVAHEINNPNHSIMSNVAALAEVWDSARPILERFYDDFGDFVLGGYEYSESREAFSEMFANALSSSKRIQVIVDELRDFARYSPSEKMTAVDVNAAVESAVVLISNMVKKSTDQFFVEYSKPLPRVMGNRQRIEQVVINLIQNACQSLQSREKAISVKTSFSAETDMILVEVRDEGKGISQEDLKLLGDPFFTTKRSAGGMGLGLWVSFNIVHEHGGKLKFSSKEGEGTLATLALPTKPDDSFGTVKPAGMEEIS